MFKVGASMGNRVPEQAIVALRRGCRRLKPAQVVSGQPKHPRRLRQIPPMRLKPHLNRDVTDFFEVGHALAGQCVLTLGDRAYRLQAGDVAFVRHGVPHKESYFREELPYQMLWFIYADVRLLKAVHIAYDPDRGLRRISSLAMKVPATAFFLLEEIMLQVARGDRFAAVRETLAQWLGHLEGNVARGRFTRKVFTGPAGSGDVLRAKRIERSHDYIHEHWRERLTLPEVARQSSLSPAYFSGLFKRVFSVAPMDYVARLRIEKSLPLLRDTALSVDEVARQVGYEDPLYFRRVFKKRMGVPPGQYRLDTADSNRF